MTRRLAAVLAVLPLTGLALLATALPAHAAVPTVTYTSSLTGGSLDNPNQPVYVDADFVLRNGDTTDSVKFSAKSSNWRLIVTLKPGDSSTQKLNSPGQYTYTAVALVLGVPVSTTSVSGAIVVSDPPAPTTSSAGSTSAAPGASSTSGKAATPSKSTTARRSTTLTRGATPRGVPALPKPSSSAPYAGPSIAYPGGVIPSIAPPALVNGGVLPPVVAPYTTATAPNGDLTTLFTTTTPTQSPSPVAAVAAGTTGTTGTGGGGAGGGRSLGLPAAVTAVLLAGLVAALLRLLLAHPAARTVARRH